MNDLFFGHLECFPGSTPSSPPRIKNYLRAWTTKEPVNAVDINGEIKRMERKSEYNLEAEENFSLKGQMENNARSLKYEDISKKRIIETWRKN